MSSLHHQSHPLDVGNFSGLSSREKQQVLTLFIHNMTVMMRDAYLIDDATAIEKFKKWNELLHRIAGTLRAMSIDSNERLPDEVLLEMIKSSADDKLKREIVWAWERSFERIASRNKQGKKTAPAH